MLSIRYRASLVGYDGVSLEGVYMKNLAACSSHPALNSISSLPLFSLGIAGLEHRFLHWSSRNTQDGCYALTQSSGGFKTMVLSCLWAYRFPELPMFLNFLFFCNCGLCSLISSKQVNRSSHFLVLSSLEEHGSLGVGGGIFGFLSLDPNGVHVLYAPVPSALLAAAASRNHRRGKGEGIGKIDAFSALDLPLGRCVEWADGGGRKERIVSASWHQWWERRNVLFPSHEWLTWVTWLIVEVSKLLAHWMEAASKVTVHHRTEISLNSG